MKLTKKKTKMMNENLFLILVFAAGMSLGMFFFGGLWFTVQKAITAKIPALWFFVSFLLRVSVLLFGFYYISSGNWQRLIVCILGFIAARFAVTYLTKSFEKKQEKRKVYHES